MATDEWIQNLDLEALEFLREHPRVRLATADSAPKKPPPLPKAKPRKGRATVTGNRLKAAVWEEMHLLICTKDKKYKELRGKLATYGKGAEIGVLTSITAFITSHLGAAWVSVWGLIAWFLIVLVRIGKEVWCKMAAP